MENTTKVESSSSQLPLTNVTSIPSNVYASSRAVRMLLILALILISFFVGVQVGKIIAPSSENSNLSQNSVPSPSVSLPSPTTTLAPLKSKHVDPVKIVELVREILKVNPKTEIVPVSFEWRHETPGISKDDLHCAGETTTISGFGFSTGMVDAPGQEGGASYRTDVNRIDVELFRFGHRDADYSSCNEGSGTVTSSMGYIVGDVVCMLTRGQVSASDKSTLSFHCGNN